MSQQQSEQTAIDIELSKQQPVEDKKQEDPNFENQEMDVELNGEKQRIKKNHLQNAGFGYFIIFFTMFMPTNCVILQTFWLNENLKSNMFEYYLSCAIMYAFYILDIMTYYKTVTIKSYSIKRPAINKNILSLDPLCFNEKKCELCNNSYKPPRSHHCTQCGNCNIRMDHHCPWTVNCVSLGNNRCFYLFTCYMMIGAVQYCYRTISYFLYLYNKTGDSDMGIFDFHSAFFYLYWVLVSFVLFPICMMLLGLTFFHSQLMLNNLTTLDLMSGMNLQCPCCPTDIRKIRQINIYDRGIIANIRNYFNKDLFFFWFPRETISDNDGSIFPRHPIITYQDVQNLRQGVLLQEQEQNEEEQKNQLPKDQSNQQQQPQPQQQIFLQPQPQSQLPLQQQLQQQQMQQQQQLKPNPQGPKTASEILPEIQQQSTKKISLDMDQFVESQKIKYANATFLINSKEFKFYELNHPINVDLLQPLQQQQQQQPQEQPQQQTQQQPETIQKPQEIQSQVVESGNKQFLDNQEKMKDSLEKIQQN